MPIFKKPVEDSENESALNLLHRTVEKQIKPIRKKHVHKYMRVMGVHSYIWKCADPHCNHFIHQSQEHYVIARASYCWNCGNEFVMTAEAMTEEFPRCTVCRAPEVVDMDIDDIISSRLK